VVQSRPREHAFAELASLHGPPPGHRAPALAMAGCARLLVLRPRKTARPLWALGPRVVLRRPYPARRCRGVRQARRGPRPAVRPPTSGRIDAKPTHGARQPRPRASRRQAAGRPCTRRLEPLPRRSGRFLGRRRLALSRAGRSDVRTVLGVARQTRAVRATADVGAATGRRLDGTCQGRPEIRRGRPQQLLFAGLWR